VADAASPAYGCRQVGRASAIRRAQGGEQAGKLGPGRADQLSDRSHPDIAEQDPQGLHDRGIGPGHHADRHTAPDQHPGPLGGTAGRQFGDKAGLADTGLAPHQDDSRVSICGPPPGRIQEFQLLDAADEVGLATRPPISPGLSLVTGQRETAAVRGRRPKMGSSRGVQLWHMPDSGSTWQHHPEAASTTRRWQATEVNDITGCAATNIAQPRHSGRTRQGPRPGSPAALLGRRARREGLLFGRDSGSFLGPGADRGGTGTRAPIAGTVDGEQPNPTAT
jgi:hypothetical protein